MLSDLENSLFPYKNSFDLFSDLSMLIVEVNGHTKGQACLFLPDNNLFIAADVCWGTEFLPFTDKMKWLPRKIQNNFEEYKKGNELDDLQHALRHVGQGPRREGRGAARHADPEAEEDGEDDERQHGPAAEEGGEVRDGEEVDDERGEARLFAHVGGLEPQ